MGNGPGPGPDIKIGGTPTADRPLPGGGVIHEVTNVDMRAAHGDTLQSIVTELNDLRSFRTHNADRLASLDERRQTMLRNIGKEGTETVHDLLPDIKEEFVDKRQFSTNPTELYDFALINDAVATSDDTALTIDVLKKVSGHADSVHISLEPVADAQDQLCFTLVRQLKGLSAKNPTDPRIGEIREQLLEIQNSPFTDKLLQNRSALVYPLAAAGDEQARQNLGSGAEAQLGKYQTRRFNLKTLEFDEVDHAAEAKPYIHAETGQLLDDADLAKQPKPEPAVEPEPPVEKPIVASEVLSTAEKKILDDAIRRIRDREFKYLEVGGGYYFKPEDINVILEEYVPQIKIMGSKAIPHLVDMLDFPADTHSPIQVKRAFQNNPNLQNTEKGKDYIATFIDGLAGVNDVPEVIKAFSVNKIRHSADERAAETLTYTLGRITYALRLAQEDGSLPPGDRSLDDMASALIEIYEHEPPRIRDFAATEEYKIEGDLLEVIALTGTDQAKQFVEQEMPHFNDYVKDKCLRYVDGHRFDDISWNEFYQYDFNPAIQLAGSSRRFPTTHVTEDQKQRLQEEAKMGVVIPLPVYSDSQQRQAA